MIQNFLRESKLKENELSQKIFVPCLQKMSMVMTFNFMKLLVLIITAYIKDYKLKR